jgi:tetratricopeptide (TPR) repeat protein
MFATPPSTALKINAMLLEARNTLEAGDGEGALKRFEQILTLTDPRAAEYAEDARLGAASAHERLQQHATAQLIYRNMLKNNPGNAYLLEKAANNALAMGQAKLAREHSEEALANRKLEDRAVLRLHMIACLACQRMNDLNGVCFHAGKILEQKPENATALWNMGVAEFRLGYKLHALNTFSRLQKRYPGITRFEKALKLVTNAVRNTPAGPVTTPPTPEH